MQQWNRELLEFHALQWLLSLIHIFVDEAHKLPETAQQMLGVTLAAEEIRNLILQRKQERYLLAAEMLEDSTGPLLRKLAQPREEAEPVEACLRLLQMCIRDRSFTVQPVMVW